MPREMVVVENVNHPGHTARIDAAKYQATRDSMLKVLPPTAPGLTQDEMMREIRKAQSVSQFPGTTSSQMAYAGWWGEVRT